MLVDGEFGLCWYSGHEGFFSQKILPQLFKNIAEIGDFERTIFFGSSGGGYAALLYSSLFSNSIAVAAAPQTSMHKYYSGHIKRYREGCWPSLSTDEQLSDVICTDLCSLYSSLKPNTIIYLQSAGDQFHTRNHFAPFVDSISKVRNSRFIFHSEFWGGLSHSRSITIEAYTPWLRAALLSPSIEVDDILQTYRSLVAPENVEKNNVHSIVQTPKLNDLKLSDVLRNYYLRKPVKS